MRNSSCTKRNKRKKAVEIGTRIWFNNWFNTSYFFMELLKNNSDGHPVEIYGTNLNPKSLVFEMCDYSETEPDLIGPDYVAYCLEFCRKHDIDVFIPRRGMMDIVHAIGDFNRIGTQVLLCPDPELLGMLNDKARLYESIEPKGIVPVPAYRIVNTPAQFRQAYEELTAQGCQVCFKPVQGEGGSGFRILDDGAETAQKLFSGISFRVSYHSACRALEGVDRFADLMMMEYLDGTEYSIDCLADAEGVLQCAIPRRKVDSRIRQLVEDPSLIRIAEDMAREYRIPFIYNIQVKERDGVAKLLEINPRMSGGLHISCMSGVNYPYAAVRLLQKAPVELPKPDFNVSVYQIETAVPISR